MREWWSRLHGWIAGRRIGDDLAEEVQTHLEMETADRIAGGMEPDKARMAAQRQFGNSAIIVERAREAWGFPTIESFFEDVH